MTQPTCETCRFWTIRPYASPKTGVCSMVHCGGGQRKDRARIFPVTSGAYLETEPSFFCCLHQPKQKEE